MCDSGAAFLLCGWFFGIINGWYRCVVETRCNEGGINRETESAAREKVVQPAQRHSTCEIGLSTCEKGSPTSEVVSYQRI